LNSSSFVALKPGLNKIGCVILGWRRSAKFDNGSFKNKFIDFKWYSIQLIPLNITPDPLVGRMLTDYTLIARTQGFAPANAKYVWDFGDGTPEVTKVNDSTVVHKFKEDDEYDVMVTLYDNSTNKKLCEAHSTAEIKSDMLSELQSYSCVSFLLAADFKYSNGGPDTIRICNWRNWDGYELKWEGTKFSAEYIWYYDGLFLGVDSCVGRLTGEMSSDGLTVKSLSGRFYWQWESNERGLEVLSIAEIPLDKEWTQHDVQPQYVLKGSEVIGQVVDLSYQKSWRPYMSNEVKTTFLEDVSYLNIDKPPIIKVQFYK
jgi:hypothetical protein